MTLIRDKTNEYPHLFYPNTAKSLGLHAAVVQSAIFHIKNLGDSHSVDLREILQECSYLTKDEVRQGYKLLVENGYLEEVGNV